MEPGIQPPAPAASPAGTAADTDGSHEPLAPGLNLPEVRDVHWVLVGNQGLRAGWSLTAARKTPIVFGMFLAMTMFACEFVESDILIVFFMSLSFFGKGIGSLGWAVVSDTSPKEAGGVSGGLFNTFGNAAGIVTPIIIGYLVQSSGSFGSALAFVSAAAVVALIMMVFFVGKIERVELKSSLTA